MNGRVSTEWTRTSAVLVPEEAQLLDNQVEGGDQRHRRHQSRQDDREEACRPAVEAAPGKGVGCRRAER